MKGACFFLAVGLLVSQCLAGESTIPKPKARPTLSIVGFSISPGLNLGKVDTCKACVDLSTDVIKYTIDFILEGIVPGSCDALCDAVADKTNPAVGEVCQVLCDILGIKEFIQLIDNADIDPIFYCEIAKICAVNDHGDANFNSFDVSPKQGPRGTTFTLGFQYRSNNGTGTGQIDLSIDTVDGVPLGQAFLHESEPAGSYNGQFMLKAETDPNCDPTQGPCETWEHGNYTVHLAICNGECGSKHPHSTVYDTTAVTFEIVKDKGK